MRIYLVIVGLLVLWYDQVDASDCGGKCLPKHKKCKWPCEAEKCPHGRVCCYSKKKRPKFGCVPNEKPGKCPVKVGPISSCIPCLNDGMCAGANVKCCDKCCSVVPPIECKNKKTGRKGECLQRHFCKPPYYIDPFARCPRPFHKKCVCCMKGPKPPPKTTTTRKPPPPKTTTTRKPPPLKPGKCPVLVGPITNCRLCLHDGACPGDAKCCNSCCTANIVFPKCFDKHGKQGECRFKEFCKPPLYEWFFNCKGIWRKCVCCFKKTKPTPPPPPKENPGKCPPVPRPCFPAQCSKDSDCGKVKKCCNRCCIEPIRCKKDHVEGLCVRPDDCRPPHVKRWDIKCETFIGQPKCVCCVKGGPPPKRCTVSWAGNSWTGDCVPKSHCRKPKVECKTGNSQCPGKHVCCFDKGKEPVFQACVNLSPGK